MKKAALPKVRRYTGRAYRLIESSKHYHIVLANGIITAVLRDECADVQPPKEKEEV